MLSILPRLAVASILPIVFLGLTGCGIQPNDSWGEAYVAPATLSLRRELRQKNSVVAVLKHGDHVSVLDVRRRYVKVRTDKGTEGWLDSTELLSPEQMQEIRESRRKMLALPSEGAATVFEALNVHIDPSRHSPAFAKIPDAGSVMVLAHKIVPKITGPATGSALTFHKPERLSKKPKKSKSSKTTFRPPRKPSPPGPPSNWQDLPGLPSYAGAKDATAANQSKESEKPVVMESWSLVRLKNNQCGWVLSRNLMMSIPDDVAQYAEGKQITSYFNLGTVNDEEKGVRHNWLWTTLSGAKPFDFDSWRVFLWNRHRHRYETSYRRRDLEGYFPVHVDAPAPNVHGRTFELVTKDDDGQLRRRTYLFDGTLVHLAGAENYYPEEVKNASDTDSVDTKKASPSGWLGREWQALQQKWGKRH